MTETTVRGKFMWHTLLTADAKAAAEFYGKVIGWRTQTASDDSPTLLLSLPSGPLAGVLQFPEEQPANPAAHWLPYIGTPDIRDTIEQCQSLGGTVLKDVTAIANMGEFAVLADPQGAEFAVYMPSGDADGKEAAAKIGEFSWHELATTDLTAARDFYQQLFAWEQIAAHDMGPMGTYLIFGRNGKQLGGMFKAMGEDPAAPNWLSYVRVADIDKSAAKVRAAGGQVSNGPVEVPGGDWIAQGLDPQGAAFAVHALAQVAKTKPATPAAAETSATESEDFTATLVMDRDSLPVPAARKKSKRKTKAAAPQPAKGVKSAKSKSGKTVKSAAKNGKKSAAKTQSATPKVKKSKKTTKKASRTVAKVGKKATKRVSKPTKSTARKQPSRPPTKAKKAAKRKK